MRKQSLGWLLGGGIAALAIVTASACGSDSDSGSRPIPAGSGAAQDSSAGSDSEAGSGSERETGDDVRRVEAGDSITVFYHGTLANGEIFDSGRDRGQPLPFVVGSGQVIQGFDNAVIGLKVGDVVTVTLPPTEAYGERDPELVLTVPLNEAPEGLSPGDSVTFANGAPGVVLEVTAETVTIDANNQLAGEELTFEIEVLTIE